MVTDSQEPPGSEPGLLCAIPLVDISDPPRVLVVDDDQLVRDMLARRLDHRGYRTMQAPSGAAALELIDQARVDIVLLDVQMPQMNGFEALQRIRVGRSAGVLPVIMVTGRDRSEDVVEALALGANDYICKPIDLAILLARIDTQLQRTRSERSRREAEERTAAILAGASDGVWDWALATNEMFCSEEWRVRFGCATHGTSLSVSDWFDRIHLDDRARVRSEIDAHVAGLSPHLQVEYRMKDASDTFRWVLTRGLVARDAAGRAVRMAGSFTDISNLRRADVGATLSSQTLLRERLGYCIDTSRRQRDFSYAVLVVELQGLRAINETHGRSVGDRLLAAVAARLEYRVRIGWAADRAGGAEATLDPRVTLARLEGDEFAMLVPGVRTDADSIRVAESIHEALAQPFDLAGRRVYLAATIGIVPNAVGYRHPDEVLRDAGVALSRARALGRSRHAVFVPDMRNQAVARQRLESDLRPAIEHGQFRLQYQPIVRVDREAVVGFEALLRWQHPDLGLLAPDEFIALAEDAELMVPVGRWVLGEACRQVSAWRKASLITGAFRMSVNLSAREFQGPAAVESIGEILRDHGVAAEDLEVEITERTAMADDAIASTRVSQLRSLGVSVCLDDFGAGHSSLAYLHRFPVDRLKIDRSFVARLFESGADDGRPIVRAILAMARDMGIEVVAEGVERVEQLDLLCGLSCALGQGFLFSKPVDAAAATAILRDGLPANAWQVGQPSLPALDETGSSARRTP